MNKLFFILFLVSSSLIFFPNGINGQDPNELNSEVYDSLSQNYQYEETEWALKPKQILKFEKKKKEYNPDNHSNLNLPLIGNIFEIIMILLLLVVAGVIVYLIFKDVKSDKLISSSEINLDNIEDIEKLDTEALLEDALRVNDYRLALRIQFLKVLQNLSQEKLILWKNKKTNSQYLNEMYGHPSFEDFKKLVLSFDRVWYGNKAIDKLAFEEISTYVSQFLKIKTND